MANDCLDFTIACQTITYAISQALPEDGISLARGTFNESALLVDRNIVIFGLGANLSIINGQQQNRVFTINPGIKASLCNLTVSQGKSLKEGGAIYNEGELMVAHAMLTTNTAPMGGAISNNAILHLIDTNVSDNRAVDGNGGGINNRGEITMRNCIPRGNSSTASGGALFASDKSLVAFDTSSLRNNSANLAGGALYKQSSASLTSVHLTIANNSPQNCAADEGTVFTNADSNSSSDESCTFSAGANNSVVAVPK